MPRIDGAQVSAREVLSRERENCHAERQQGQSKQEPQLLVTKAIINAQSGLGGHWAQRLLQYVAGVKPGSSVHLIWCTNIKNGQSGLHVS